MLHVVAGIIESNGKILLCQRHRNSKRFPLKWEFPGGKVEQNETPEQAIVRELNEELGIIVSEVEKLDEYVFEYEDEDPFYLHFFKIINFENTVQNLQFEDMTWIRWQKISNYDLLGGDKPFLEHWALGAEL